MQVWEGYVPGAKAEEASTSDEQANGHAPSDGPRESVDVTVTDVTSGSHFYVQVSCLISLLNDSMQSMHTPLWAHQAALYSEHCKVRYVHVDKTKVCANHRH